MKHLIITVLIGLVIVSGCSKSPDEARQKQIKEAQGQLTSTNWHEQIKAIITLVELDAKEAIPEITRLLKDNDSMVRRRAVEALAQLGAKETIPDITKLLQDKKISVRYRAIEVLWRLGAKEAIPDITKLLRDDDSGVRRAAIFALGQLGDKEVIPQLVQFLDDDSYFTRGLTAIALVELGAKDKVTTKAIEDIKSLSTPNYFGGDDYSDRARAALKELGVEDK